MHFHLIWNEWIGPQQNHYTFIKYIKLWLLVDHFHHRPTTIPPHHEAQLIIGGMDIWSH
jgi:hypothetical protein